MLQQLEHMQREQRAAEVRTKMGLNSARGQEVVAETLRSLRAISAEHQANMAKLEAKHTKEREEREAKRKKEEEEREAKRKKEEEEREARHNEREVEALYREIDDMYISKAVAAAGATPNDHLNLAMSASSPTCVMCTLDEDERTDGSITEMAQGEVAQSVATSAITLESTLHLRQRKGERGISRRELQSTLKHGEAERDAFTGRVLHRLNNIAFVTDAFSKVGITAWNENEESCRGRGCNREAECFRGFCEDCCWGCDEHERCSGRGCTSRDLCVRGFCRSCCFGSSRCDCVPGW